MESLLVVSCISLGPIPIEIGILRFLASKSGISSQNRLLLLSLSKDSCRH